MRIIAQWGLSLLAILVVVTSTAVDAECHARCEVHVENRRLSIRAVQTPLATLLAKVSRESGIEIFLQGQPEDTMTIQMDQVAVERGIKRLLRGHNHAFTYVYNTRNEVVVKQLYVYSPAGRGDMARIIPGAPDIVRLAGGKTEDIGINIYPETPSGRDPLVTMQAIDPLMKINQAGAPYLPENFHGEKSKHAGRR